MSKDPSQERETFVGLTSFEHINTSASSLKSSLVKSSTVKEAGVAKIDVFGGSEAEPSIYVHRHGDIIRKIEFVCSCGKSTHLDLEYDAE